MTQSGSTYDPSVPSGVEVLSNPSCGINGGSIDETDSIISIYGKLYAPSISQMSETESTIISSSMPPSAILRQLSRHGCEDVTNDLNPRSVSNGVVSTGGSSDVYRGELWNGRRVGLKCLRFLIGMDEEGEKQLKRAARELYIWSKCKHPNIQELIGVALYDNRVAMVSPWMKNGNLGWYISQNLEVDRYNLCSQVAAAVAYLRECGVVHGDIKVQNFLVSENHITAPEILHGDTQHTFEGDVYALGMTILEIITGSPPWVGMLDVAVVYNLVKKAHPPRPEAYMPTGNRTSDLLWELMVKCWRSEPQQRPHAMQVRDELDEIKKRRQRTCYETKEHPDSVDTQLLVEPTSIHTPGSKQRSFLVHSRSNLIPEPTEMQPRELRALEVKQRKLRLLEKRKQQEERARARSRIVMAKREMMINEQAAEYRHVEWTGSMGSMAEVRTQMSTHPIPPQLQIPRLLVSPTSEHSGELVTLQSRADDARSFASSHLSLATFVTFNPDGLSRFAGLEDDEES
ncbi:hypothetical protein OPQ81_011905 [Rhizoctonia solani]|nr:hypothetical protein OPQ81_011905 [Rhizoctonia solani]